MEGTEAGGTGPCPGRSHCGWFMFTIVTLPLCNLCSFRGADPSSLRVGLYQGALLFLLAFLMSEQVTVLCLQSSPTISIRASGT